MNTETGKTTATATWMKPTVVDDNGLNPNNVKLFFTPEQPGVNLNAQDAQQTVPNLERGVYQVEYNYTDVNTQIGRCPFSITIQGK